MHKRCFIRAGRGSIKAGRGEQRQQHVAYTTKNHTHNTHKHHTQLRDPILRHFPGESLTSPEVVLMSALVALYISFMFFAQVSVVCVCVCGEREFWVCGYMLFVLDLCS